jgi:hypothetical protein
MSIETLMLAFGFGWAIWVLIRIHRRRQASQMARPDDARTSGPKRADASQGTPARREPDTMPRVGQPGTITFNQIKALQRNGFTPDRQWSREEAALILDTVAYLRIVCRNVADSADGPPPLEVQNELLRFILTRQDLRDYVRKWGEDRRDEGRDPLAEAEEEQAPSLPRNNQFDSVAAKAQEFLTA